MSAPRAIIGVVLLVSALGVAGWYGVIEPKRDAIEEANRREARLKEQYTTLAGQAVNLDLYRQQLLTLEERFGALNSVLPGVGHLWSPEGQQDVERRVRSLANSLGVPEPMISSGPTSYDDHIASRRYDITASGDFRQLVQFLQGISTGSGRLWTVHHAALRRQENGRGLMLVVALQAHGFVHSETLAAWKKERK